jgi:hypothetical protein
MVPYIKLAKRKPPKRLQQLGIDIVVVGISEGKRLQKKIAVLSIRMGLQDA